MMSEYPRETTQLFQCPTCGKSYSRKDFLTRHELNHKNIRPYKCDSCNLSFTRRDMLTKHFKSNAHKRMGCSNVHNNSHANSKEDIRDREDSQSNAGSCNSSNDSSTGRQHLKRESTSSISSSSTSPNGNLMPMKAEHHNIKKLRIANFLNDYDEKIYTPPLQPTIIRPSSSSGTLSGGAVDVNFGHLISTNGDPSRSDLPIKNGKIPSGYMKRRFASKDHAKITNSDDENPKEFLSLLDMSGGFIDNLLWLFTDNFPAEMVNESNANKSSHPESAVIDVDATKNFDIAPASYDLADIHSHMFGHTRVRINETTRRRILDIFADVDALENVSLSRLDEYLDLYWFNFAQSFPIIHQVTFDPNNADVYLLISILIIGMAHTADRLEYELSVIWNKKFRKVIREVIDEKTQLPLPLMQALILHNFSARNFGDTTLCQNSQIEHGSNLLYLKFSGFLDNLNEPMIYRTKQSSEKDLYDQWQKWIYYETSKRTVFFEFICDTQHVTFSKLELSAFDIKLELPCTDEVWSASTPQEFFAAYQIQPNSLVTRPRLNIHPTSNENHMDNAKNEEDADKFTKVVMERYISPTDQIIHNENQPNNKLLGKWPSFLWSLKSLMMEYKDNQLEFSLNCYSPFTRYILLHSLIRVCWHTRGHGLLDLGIISQNRLNDFFNKLEYAFANWKGLFDLHIKLYDDQVKNKENRIAEEDDDAEQIYQDQGIRSQILLNNYGPTNACWANLSLFYTGLFTLYADISSLTKFATEYKSTPITVSNNFHHQDMKEIEYERNTILVEQWAGSSNAEIAVVEACKFLTLVYKHEETINTYSHVPPSVYIAIIIIWSFEKMNHHSFHDDTCDDETRNSLDLNPDRYFDRRGHIIHILVRNDAKNYMELITKLANEDEEPINDPDTLNRIKVQKREQYKQRQYYTVGVVCYALYLLKHCKWSHDIDIVKKLEYIVDSYNQN